MPTREEVYAKFGVTAEAAQLFETELGTLLLGANGLREGWHVKPDGERGRVVLENIQRGTLGGLFSTLRKHIEFSEDIEARMTSAVQARNRLNHGFFEKHNFSIQTDQGRQGRAGRPIARYGGVPFWVYFADICRGRHNV